MGEINLELDFSNSINQYIEYFSSIVPFFGAILGLSVISQVIVLVFGGLAAYTLAIDEKIVEIISAFNAQEFSEIALILGDTPSIFLILSIGFIFASLVFLVGYSAINGGLIKIIKDINESKSINVTNGLIGASCYYKKITSIYLLFIGLVLLFVLPGIILVQINPLMGFPYLALITLVLLVIYLLFFSFAKEALVSEDLEVMESLKKNFDFIKKNIIEVIFYVIIFIIAVSLISTLNLALSMALGTTTQGLTNVLMIFLIYPFFILLKVNMYYDHVNLISETDSNRELKEKIERGFKKSINELKNFTISESGKIVFAFAILVVGAIWGRQIGFGLPKIDLSPLFGGEGFSSGIFIHLMFHNFSTAIGILFSGFMFGLPTIGALLFNGAIIGLVSTYVESLNVFFVGILPHGVIEVPALCIAGAMGLKLGQTTLNYFRRNKEMSYLGNKIEKLFYGVMGTFVLFLIAALIEALVTPYLLELVT